MKKIAIHVVVSGRVQGVFFRDSTRRLAHSLGIKGWVRNLPDGRVEALFEGEEDAVRKIVEFVKHGPERAQVNGVEEREEQFSSSHSTFEIR